MTDLRERLLPIVKRQLNLPEWAIESAADNIVADVLAALREAGALLPELDDPNMHLARVEFINGDISVYVTETWRRKDGSVRAIVGHNGTGPTIPAAIANALEGAK